jgi:hypothetical protein
MVQELNNKSKVSDFLIRQFYPFCFNQRADDFVVSFKSIWNIVHGLNTRHRIGQGV